MMSIPLHQDYWSESEPFKLEIEVTKLTVSGLDPRLWIEKLRLDNSIAFRVKFCDETIPTRDFRDAALVTSRLDKVLARLPGAPDPFDEWRATKRQVQRLERFAWESPGLVYEGDLYIRELPDSDFRYHLQIMNDKWESNDLLDLERKLYDYAKSEGLI